MLPMGKFQQHDPCGVMAIFPRKRWGSDQVASTTAAQRPCREPPAIFAAPGRERIFAAAQHGVPSEVGH